MHAALQSELVIENPGEVVSKIYAAIVAVKLDTASIFESVVAENKVKNARLIEEMFRHLTIHKTRFFNKLPKVAFHHTTESKSRHDGKIFESTALNKLDKNPKDLEDAELIDVIDGLLDYKELTITVESSAPGRRNNDRKELINLVARHLYLFFAAYPQTGECLIKIQV